MTDLPILDITHFTADPHSTHAEGFAHKLREACHNTGFCYIRANQTPAIMNVARQFFSLPLDVRKEIAMINSPQFRGYTLLGDERTAGKSDWRDQIDFGLEKDVQMLSASDPEWLLLRGPNLWPAQLPHMPKIILDWMDQMDAMGTAIMQALAMSFDLPLDHFDYMFSPKGDARMKLIRYHAQDEETDTGQGVGWHHDTGMLTFIQQDRVGGLQIDVDGVVSDVEPVSGTYVMNLGEMLQAATNGYLRATQHRVVSPPPGSERLSIAYFYNPVLEANIEPVPLPAEFASKTNGFQNVDPDDPIFANYGENSLKSRFRAHPDVAAKYYSSFR